MGRAANPLAASRSRPDALVCLRGRRSGPEPAAIHHEGHEKYETSHSNLTNKQLEQ